MAYIKKEPIVEFITKGLNNPDKTKAYGYDAIEILTEIEYAPEADVVEVKHGEWLMCLTDEPWRKGFHGRCSECGATYTYNINKMPRRCDNCDALMDGGKKE